MKAPKKVAPNHDKRKAAALVGKSYLRAQLVGENPELKGNDLRAKVTEKWKASRQTYMRFGSSVIRKLAAAGYALTPAPDAAPGAPAKRRR